MKRRITLCALALISSSAIAADTGFYLYGSAGQTKSERKAEVDATITNLGITAFTSTYDENDSGAKLQIGWRFNDYFAIEGGFVDLGKYTYEADSTAPLVATRDGHVEADGITLGVVASLPLNPAFSLFAKAGVLDYDLDYRCDGTGIPCTNPDRSASDTEPYYGVGVAWNASDNWFLRVEHEVFQDIGQPLNAPGSTGTTQADIELTSIGVGYRF